MRAALVTFLAAATLLAASPSNAAPAAAPHVTVGADMKQLIFDWDDVSGAAYYRLMYQVGSDPYKPLLDNIATSTIWARSRLEPHR